MKTEDEIIINKKTASMLGLPKLSMDVMAKIYLAMAVKSVDKMTYVYTLTCLKSGEKYNLWPMTEILSKLWQFSPSIKAVKHFVKC